jgi:2,4-didehydro-3-deoxy-L-rhamnonate hydrolase
MKLVNTSAGFGRVDGDDVVVLWPSSDRYFAGDAPAGEHRVRLADVDVLAPSPRPGKVICVGLNYRQHALEAGMDVPTVPVLFPKFANSVVGPDVPVPVPSCTSQVDYEAELAVVIGRPCSGVDSDEALDYVAGYACSNDLSARDLQFETNQWMLGKAIDGFLPLGPYLVTPDEVGDPQTLRLRCWVNGELRQDSDTSDMVFGVAEIIAFVSRTCRLDPGDVIITGTPFGVGMGFDPPRWVGPGDTMVVEIDGLGRLSTTLTA